MADTQASEESERPAELAGKLAREFEDRVEQTHPREHDWTNTGESGKSRPQIVGVSPPDRAQSFGHGRFFRVTEPSGQLPSPCGR